MGCKCTTISTPTNPICKTGCIVGGYHVVYSKDSVGICGQVGTIDFKSLDINTRNSTVCGTDVVFKLDSWDSGFDWVALNDGIITYAFKTTALKTACYRIRGQVICPVTGRGDFFEIVVCVKDVCATISCPDGQICDECAEGCIDAGADISTT